MGARVGREVEDRKVLGHRLQAWNGGCFGLWFSDALVAKWQTR